MKREIRREVLLTPFSIGIAELELLWTRLTPLFSDGKDISFYVDIEFDDVKLTFGSLDEVKASAYPKSKSTNFTLHCHASDRAVHIYTSPHAGSRPKLVISSDSEVWVAGAREVVLTVINQNRVWHYWMNPIIISRALWLLLLGWTFAFALIRGREVPAEMVAGVAGSLFVMWILLSTMGRLLPLATLRLCATSETFWRRYSVELTLGLAILSVLFTAYGVFGPRG